MKNIISKFPNWNVAKFTISNNYGFNFYTATQAVLDEVIDLQNEALEDNGYVSSVKLSIQKKENQFQKVFHEFTFTKDQENQVEKTIFNFFSTNFSQAYNIQNINLEIHLTKEFS